jgi:hypothetical protein
MLQAALMSAQELASAPRSESGLGSVFPLRPALP